MIHSIKQIVKFINHKLIVIKGSFSWVLLLSIGARSVVLKQTEVITFSCCSFGCCWFTLLYTVIVDIVDTVYYTKQYGGQLNGPYVDVLAIKR